MDIGHWTAFNMKPTIMKFGGTSVEGATAFQNAARIVFDRQALRPVVVVSAMAGFTDALLDSLQQALTAGEPAGAESIEKHFERHLRVIDALLGEEADRIRALVERSRSDVAELLNAAATEVREARGGVDRKRRKFFEDAIVSHGERLSAALLAAVLAENKVNAVNVDARRCIITDDDYGCATPLMSGRFGNLNSTCSRDRVVNDPVLGGFIGRR